MHAGKYGESPPHCDNGEGGGFHATPLPSDSGDNLPNPCRPHIPAFLRKSGVEFDEWYLD